MWQAIRASSAAPGYFQEFVLGKELHQVWNVLKRFLLEQNVIVGTAKMKISYLVVILKFFCSTAEDPFKVYFPHINLPYMWLLIDGKVCKEITKRSSRVWNCHRDDRTMHHSLKALKAFASFQSIPKTLLFLKERCQRPLLSTVFFFSLNCVCVCVWMRVDLLQSVRPISLEAVSWFMIGSLSPEVVIHSKHRECDDDVEWPYSAVLEGNWSFSLISHETEMLNWAPVRHTHCLKAS